jgi:hypothetical protein
MNVRAVLSVVCAFAAVACDESAPPAGVDGGSSDGGPPSDRDSGAGEDGGSSDGGRSDGGSTRRGAAAWILEHFAGAPERTGEFDARTRVETPALIRDAMACCAKYAFDVVEEAAPADPQIGLVNVTIRDLVSSDAYGGGLVSARAPGLESFMALVTIEPNWPEWISYDETNKDGLVLDDSAAIYAEDLTIRGWNADSAIDNKAPISQFVRLTIEGRGNRALRYWRPGPHYLVESTLENTGGLGDEAILWFSDCDTVVLRVFDTTFNGSDTISADLVSCDNGSSPAIEYLTTDPRTTGEMHEMFSY